jgi:hypothetical protein
VDGRAAVGTVAASAPAVTESAGMEACSMSLRNETVDS